MPLYEYQCQSCGEVTVVRQGMSDAKLKTCAQAVKHAVEKTRACGSPKGKVTRLISNSSFVLKGSGWYKTDYSSKPAGKADGGEGAADGAKGKSAGEASASDKSGSKSDKKKAA